MAGTKDLDLPHAGVVAHLMAFHQGVDDPEAYAADASNEEEAVMSKLESPRQCGKA